MKKNFVYLTVALFSLSFLLIPGKVNAETEVTGLSETVKEEIELFKDADGYSESVEKLESYDLSNYKESDDKVNVYLFRGNTCSHCFDAVVFFASIAEEYGEYFNLKTYEVWSNEDNADLMTSVGEELGDDVSGVPYIVIGKKSWSGFADSYGEEIKAAIKEQYEKDASERVDVVKDMNKNNSSSSSSNDVIALLVILLITGGIVAGIVVARKNV